MDGHLGLSGRGGAREREQLRGRVRARALLAVAVVGLAIALGSCASADIRRDAKPDEVTAGDQLASSMLEALGGKQAWDDIQVLSFTWVVDAGMEVARHRHTWDKKLGLHKYEDGDLVVYTDLWSKKGRVFDGATDGKPVEVKDPKEKAEHLEKAYAAFINDSYWFIAPFKVFDEGVDRASIDGDLRLTFGDVGLTPGDAYVFDLAEDGRPLAWSFDLESGLSGTFQYEGPVELHGVTFFTRRPGTAMSLVPASIWFDGVEAYTEPRPDLFEPLFALRADLAQLAASGPSSSTTE